MPEITPMRDDADLHRILRTLVDRFTPRRIVLFGSRARGDARVDSDYDLMVELDEVVDERAKRWEMIDALRACAVSVDVIVRGAGELERRRNDPGYIDYDIAREGVLLHRREDVSATLFEPQAPRVREPAPLGPDEPESVEGWIAHAEEDLLVINTLLRAEQVPWGAVCFHAQQAAEKCLKALLIERWIKPARTHDLLELLANVRGAAYDVPEIDADCAFLNGFSVEARYPHGAAIPSETQGQEAAAAVRRIVAWADVAMGRGGLRSS
jgi:uncharacterized protein